MMTMINPTKKQRKIKEMYDKIVIPWLYVDLDNGVIRLKDAAPEDVKKKYELYMKS